MEQLTREQLKSVCEQEYKKIVDALTDFTLRLFDDVYPTLPDMMSEQDKLGLIESVIKGQADSLVGSAKAFDTKQMAADLKTRVDGGNYGSRRS